AYDQWRASTHRATRCEACHGGALTLEASFHLDNASRLYSHLKGDLPERIGFGNRLVPAMAGRCAGCHRQEYAAWLAGPHSASYSRIFLDRKYNSANLLMDDCLRCHGMHFEGGIRDLVAPISRGGPWRMLPADLANMPSMPCLSCHEIHREGQPMHKTDVQGRVPGPTQEIARPSLAFFDRRSRQYVPLAELPMPAMLEGSRLVKMSQDQRQALCYQCHAPVATMQVGSGDDRTGIGVHEGIGCLACHAQHGQKTRASCAACHPRMSNCGLDVEQMDTTFNSTSSRRNIHWVKCADCHTRGVPRKKPETFSSR
ncbi:MAG TPA: multiheme c-type cytochrome, partial [Candidatus Sulfopaludibacter sp.]|nr:multiheme c-type cytochrome [Candidatus Sulfopaludibacter sp.]